jgi:hypothetical protein
MRVAEIIVAGMISIAAQAQDHPGTRPPLPGLQAQIAQLKSETVTLFASARADLDALSPQQRLSAPPAVWRVPGALTEFRDCADCPEMP